MDPIKNKHLQTRQTTRTIYLIPYSLIVSIVKLGITKDADKESETNKTFLDSRGVNVRCTQINPR